MAHDKTQALKEDNEDNYVFQWPWPKFGSHNLSGKLYLQSHTGTWGV